MSNSPGFKEESGNLHKIERKYIRTEEQQQTEVILHTLKGLSQIFNMCKISSLCFGAHLLGLQSLVSHVSQNGVHEVSFIFAHLFRHCAIQLLQQP